MARSPGSRARTRPTPGTTRRRAAGDRDPRRALAALDRIHAEFGPGQEPLKLELLRHLHRGRFGYPADLVRYHDLLCFLAAYPDGARLEAQVIVSLAAFPGRSDLRRHAQALAGSGIAGTPIDYRFFYPTARWLAERWPAHLRMTWGEFGNADRLEPLLPLLAHPAEIPAIDELPWTPRQWISRMKAPGEGDGAFLAARIAALPMADRARETMFDALDPPMRLLPGPTTPSRTFDRAPTRVEPRGARGAAPHRTYSTHFRARPLDRRRPDLAVAIREAPRAVRELSPREGAAYVDLARAAMVTRQRDLDAFAYADARDVRLLDYEDGLQFAWLGVIPERRLLFESVYGALTLINGVPIGYVLASGLYRSSEIAYNVFDTWRGGEAGRIYGRVLAATRHVLGSDAFTIDPYQLGDGNDEGLRSGAWWFYRKLGFAPRDPATLRLARIEGARLRRRPSYRSSLATLRRLVRENVYWFAGRERDDVLGLLPLGSASLAATRRLGERFGADRERAGRVATREAARLLGIRGFAAWSGNERAAFDAWAPIVLELPGVPGWSTAERRAAAAVIRAKGGRRESDFVLRFDAHRRLRTALRRLAERLAADS